MRILCTAPGEFIGSELETGHYYFVEKDDSGTLQQNSLFHALLYVYFVSGCFSYPVNTYEDLKICVKESLGKGYEYFEYINRSEKGLSVKTVKNREDIPETVETDENGQRMIKGVLKSWGDYSKKQRKECIDKLIAQMKMEQVSSKKFFDILNQLELNRRQYA